MVCEILSSGKALIAGPSLVSDMNHLIKDLKNIYDYNIIIDGAFFRQSFASIADGSILVIGANYSPDINKTVENANLSYKKLTLPVIPDKYQVFKNKSKVCFLKSNSLIELHFSSIIGKVDKIINEETLNSQAIFLPNTLTDELVNWLTKKPDYFKSDIVVNSGINIQLNNQNLKNLFRLENNVFVVDPINIACICYNPTSTRGYYYDEIEFANKLSNKLQRKVINVKEV